MNTTVIQLRTSLRRNVSEFIIEFLKIWFVIKPLQSLFRIRNQHNLLKLKNSLPNTVGSNILQLLIKNNLKPIPFYEEHDLKHLILGYGMSSEDEVRMQFYLLGNGNRSISCILFTMFGLLLPSCWKTFYKDYYKGKNATRILDIKLDDCINSSMAELRMKYKSI